MSGLAQEVNFYYSIVDVTSGTETKNGNVVMKIPVNTSVFDQPNMAQIRDVEGGIF